MLRKKKHCKQFREQSKGEQVAIFRIKMTKHINQVSLARNEHTEYAQGLFILFQCSVVLIPTQDGSLRYCFIFDHKQILLEMQRKKSSSKFYDKTFFLYLFLSSTQSIALCP